MHKDLVEILEPALTVATNYIVSPVSPFRWVSPATAPSFIKFMQMNIDADELQILLGLNLPTFKAILNLPEKLMKELVEMLIVEDN